MDGWDDTLSTVVDMAARSERRRFGGLAAAYRGADKYPARGDRCGCDDGDGDVDVERNERRSSLAVEKAKKKKSEKNTKP